MFKEQTRHLPRVGEDGADCKNVLLAVHPREKTAERWRKVTETDVGGKADRDNEVNAAQKENGRAKNLNELMQEMCAAVLQEDFHVDDPAFPHPAAQHCVEEIQLPIVVDALPNKIGHFEKDKHADDERYP